MNEFEIERLLETLDLDDGTKLVSLLDTALQDRMETELVAFATCGRKTATQLFPDRSGSPLR